ncbi:MAG: FAD-dependent oxidoreductase [Deltaproteobacteria bacterium]|nr:FAD-dependent oxidoreductase [Deltaproteobacteria bacterium]
MHVVIVGAGYAGLLCAFRLRRRVGDRCQITVVDRNEAFVERIRLHQWLAGDALPAVALEPWLSSAKIQFVQGTLTALDPTQHTLSLGERTLGYDRLVLALGSQSASNIPGIETQGYTLERAWALRDELPRLARARGAIAVLGTGLTGIECATELAERYPDLRVSLVSRGGLAPFLSAKSQRYVRAVCAKLGIHMLTDCAVHEVTAKGLRTDDSELAFDSVLGCTGFAPPRVIRQSLVATDAQGYVEITDTLRSRSHADIFAIGDVAGSPPSRHAALQKSCKTAMPMGAYVADAITSEFTDHSLGMFSLRDAGVCVSLGRRHAVVQAYRRGAAPEGPVLTGALAVFVKERIARFTLASLHNEARDRLAYRWLREHTPKALAQASYA